MKLVYADAHLHSNPVRGLGAVEISRRFRARGGWFAALVALSPWHYNISVRGDPLGAYVKSIEIHALECKKAREEGLRVSCFAGFHPADVDHLIDSGMQPHRVLELGEKVLEHIARFCREGVLQGIGEVGRQHFKTSPERVAIAQEILTRAMEYAKDLNCPIHMHLENAGEATVATIDRLAARVGVEKRLLLFHHSKPNVAAAAVQRGYYATIPGKEQLLRYYFGNKMPLVNVMIESDYIDDPKRPCVSSCPWEVIEREERLLREGIVDEEKLYKVNIDNVVRFYRVEPP